MKDDKIKAADLPCGITGEQLADWKREYGAENVLHLTHTYKGKVYNLLMRRPNFDTLMAVEADLFKRKVLSAGFTAMCDCELASDPEVHKLDAVKAAMCVTIAGMLELGVAEVKKA